MSSVKDPERQVRAVSLEELREKTLSHYEEAATAVNYWVNVIPQAIREHYDRRILQRDKPDTSLASLHAADEASELVLKKWAEHGRAEARKVLQAVRDGGGSVEDGWYEAIDEVFDRLSNGSPTAQEKNIGSPPPEQATRADRLTVGDIARMSREGTFDTYATARAETLAEVREALPELIFTDSWGVDAVYVSALVDILDRLSKGEALAHTEPGEEA